MTPTRSGLLFAVCLFSVSLVLGGCRTPANNKAAEPPSLNVTSWTDKTELYMEYPPLVTGHSARFAVHLTTLADFKALNAGKPSIDLTPESGGRATTFAGTPPLRPGAFRVEGTPPAAGRYRMVLSVDAPGLADRHDLGIVTVFAEETAAVADAEKRQTEDPEAIAYLKEQQWTNEFATAPARDMELRNATRAPATIGPLTGGEAVVAAPAAGRFAADALVTVGATVESGHVLGRLEPRLAGVEDRATLAGDVAQAQVGLDAARAEEARARRLLTERAVPARRVEEAERAVVSAEARLQAAQARLTQRDQTLRSGGSAASGNAFVLQAPISGRVIDVSATLGASYDEGAPLFRIMRTDRVELRAQVPPSEATAARQVTDLAFEIPGQPDPVPLRPTHQHDAGAIDPNTGALPVVFEVGNPSGQLLIGQGGTALLYTGERKRMTAVPKAAVLFEAGRPYVWVQEGGERFSRKHLDIAARDGDWIGIRAGLSAGARVVTRGAYEVQLAAAAKGLPAEGHVH